MFGGDGNGKSARTARLRHGSDAYRRDWRDLPYRRYSH